MAWWHGRQDRQHMPPTHAAFLCMPSRHGKLRLTAVASIIAHAAYTHRHRVKPAEGARLVWSRPCCTLGGTGAGQQACTHPHNACKICKAVWGATNTPTYCLTAGPMWVCSCGPKVFNTLFTLLCSQASHGMPGLLLSPVMGTTSWGVGLLLFHHLE